MDDRIKTICAVALLSTHELVNFVLFFINFFRTISKKEKKEEDIQNQKDELTVHSIISALVFCILIGIFCFPFSYSKLFNLFNGIMIIHFLVSIVVLIINLSSESSSWLSWVFEIVSLIVVGFGIYLSTGSTPIGKANAATAFGKKLLNFGKRKLK